MAYLPLTARCFLASLLRRLTLLLADEGKGRAKVLILDDRPLRDLTQLVKGGVGQVEPAVADRQPAAGHRRRKLLGCTRSRVAHRSGSRDRLLRHAAAPARPSEPHAATTKLP